jgi:hypothetical protein
MGSIVQMESHWIPRQQRLIQNNASVAMISPQHVDKKPTKSSTPFGSIPEIIRHIVNERRIGKNAPQRQAEA